MLNIIPTAFSDVIDSIETMIDYAVDAIDDAQLEKALPFHYNTIEVTIPSYNVQKYVPGMDADIHICFYRTKFTEKYNLAYTADDILEFYKTVSITIGKNGSLRVYHLNAKRSKYSQKHSYSILKDNIERLYILHEKHQLFELDADLLNQLADNLITIVNPSNSHFPRSFTM